MAKSGRKSDKNSEVIDDETIWQRVTRDIKAYKRQETLSQVSSSKNAGQDTAGPDKGGPDKGGAPLAVRPISGSKNRKTSLRADKNSALPDTQKLAPMPVDVRSGEHAGLNRSTLRRLKQGEMDIAARLDLHGMTAAQAERRLYRFIETAALAQHRCVLVITGKGANGMGVLRRQVPLWLKSPPLSQNILALSSAKPADGGDGALYVMLRRQRKIS
ncbi:MAG: hypothetical protein GWP36_10435 [Bacteroidetes bacterium]|nr:hypothetical protein [Bacteroidota bacterium]